MPTPTLAQARRQYRLQQQLAAGVAAAIRRLFVQDPRPSVERIAATASGYQLAAATLVPRVIAGYADSTRSNAIAQPFVGVSSLGFPLTEPIIAVIDRHVPAPPQAVPPAWWTDAESPEFLADLERLLASEIQDAARTVAQVEIASRPDWTNYVRMLNPPSCARCAILAGRIYRDLEAFQRHPLCDCVMVPVTDWQAAHDAGLIASPNTAFEKGQVVGLSKADRKAVEDGADMTEVVNATRGTSAPGITNAFQTDLFGHRVKATFYGTTKRAAWRRANPTIRVRLRPESIYAAAKGREDALRLLRLYGYII